MLMDSATQNRPCSGASARESRQSASDWPSSSDLFGKVFPYEGPAPEQSGAFLCLHRMDFPPNPQLKENPGDFPGTWGKGKDGPRCAPKKFFSKFLPKMRTTRTTCTTTRIIKHLSGSFAPKKNYHELPENYRSAKKLRQKLQTTNGSFAYS